MINLKNSRFYETAQEDLAAGVSIQEEGQALEYVRAAGKTVVVPSTGSNKNFAGISIARNAPPLTLPMFIEDVITDGKVDLVQAPIDGTVFLAIAGAPAAEGSSAGQYTIVGTDAVFNAADEGKKVVVQFTYAPTAIEARGILGDAPYGGQSANLEGTIAVVKRGQIETNMFDTSVDWTDVMFVKLGANGRFVPGTANDRVPNVIVKNSPSAGSPFLLVDLNIA